MQVARNLFEFKVRGILPFTIQHVWHHDMLNKTIIFWDKTPICVITWYWYDTDLIPEVKLLLDGFKSQLRVKLVPNEVVATEEITLTLLGVSTPNEVGEIP